MSHILPGISKDFPGISSTINRKSIPAPTFEFSVASEEGIHLFVDMNSSLLDCRTRFENEIRTCNCFQMNKSQSFREELQYLGCKFEQRKNSYVSDTKSCTELNCADENVDSGHYDIVVKNDSSLLSYPKGKNEHSGILVQEKHKCFLDVSEQLEQEGENSICSCFNSVASDLVDVNSNLRGLMVGDGSESLSDDQTVMLLSKTTITDIENSGNGKPCNASSSDKKSLLSVDLKAPSMSSTDAPARHQSGTETTASIELRKQTAMLRTGGGCKRKRRVNEYSERILRSAHNRQSYRRNCKLQRRKIP